MRPVGRRRTKNLDLPPRMRRVGNAYYYDLGGKPRRWEPLGSDKAKALTRWAELRNAAEPGRTVASLVSKFLAQCDVAENTIIQYRQLSAIILKYFGTAPVARIRPGHIQEFHDRYPAKMLGRKSVLLFKAMLKRAVLWEWIPVNPAAAVQVRAQGKRKRYLTDAEFLAIRAKLGPRFQVAADLAFRLGLRVSDVVRFRFADVRDGQISIVQKKTGIPLLLHVTPEVEEVLNAAKALNPPLRAHVVCTARGKPYQEGAVSGAFQKAAKAAGITDARFHDLRAKSASDERETAQERLGHTSEQSTRSYIRTPVVVMPIRRRIG